MEKEYIEKVQRLSEREKDIVKRRNGYECAPIVPIRL